MRLPWEAPAIVLSIAALSFGVLTATGYGEAEAQYPDHCQGVTFEEALYVVSRMNEAKVSHDFWAVEGPARGMEHIVGDAWWHQSWSDTYVRTNNLIALLMRGCL